MVDFVVEERHSDLANELQTYVFDLDGVIYRGDEPQLHAAATVRELRRRGRKVFFLTNNSTKSREDFRRKLASMDIEVRVDEIMTSAHATALYLRDQGAAGKSVYIVGEDGLAGELEAIGMKVFRDAAGEGVEYVVVGMDRKFTYEKLAGAQQAILAGARFIATNTDATFPLPGGRLAPGGGSLVSAIQTASGVRPLLIGKPETYSTRKVLELAGCAAEKSVMVGDRIETDVLTGNRLGMHTVLVLTGVSDWAHVEAAPHELKPDRVITDLGELLDESWGER